MPSLEARRSDHKVREGVVLPFLLEPRQRVDGASSAVSMTAYVTRTSTRKVDDPARALGCDPGVSKSIVSRICKEIDGQVALVRERRMDHLAFSYVRLDATHVNAKLRGQVVSPRWWSRFGVTVGYPPIPLRAPPVRCDMCSGRQRPLGGRSSGGIAAVRSASHSAICHRCERF